MRAAVLALVLAACGGDDAVPTEVLFPADYAATYVEVRDCRRSTDHNLKSVRVLASPEAVDAYLLRDRPFPVGSVILKEELDYADDTCSGPIEGWTVMVRLDTGSDPDLLDWDWQRTNADREDNTEGKAGCANCHAGCGVPPDGYLGTCTVP